MTVAALRAGAVGDWLSSAPGRRWLLRALLAYALIGFAVWVQRPGDFAGYLLVGNLVRSGQDIYASAPGTNTWPPFFSLLCVPLAVLAAPTPYLARAFWLLLNFASLLFILHLIARLAYGRRLSLRAAPHAALSLAAPELLVPLLLTDRYVSSNFDHLQINVVIFALALGGLTLQRHGRVLAGSAVLGGAAALKVMPVVFIPYLAYRRQWRAASYATLFTAAFSLSPVLVFGWSRFWDYVRAWRAALAVGWGVGKMNQSVYAMWDRILGHRMLPLAQDGITFLTASGAPVVTAAVVLSIAVTLLLIVWSFGAAGAADDRTALAEWGALFIASTLFGPVCWKAYLVVLLIPNVLLFAAWQSAADVRTHRALGTLLVVTFVSGGVLSAGLIGKHWADRLEMASLPALAALALLGALLWLRHGTGTQPPRRAEK